MRPGDQYHEMATRWISEMLTSCLFASAALRSHTLVAMCACVSCNSVENKMQPVEGMSPLKFFFFFYLLRPQLSRNVSENFYLRKWFSQRMLNSLK